MKMQFSVIVFAIGLITIQPELGRALKCFECNPAQNDCKLSENVVLKECQIITTPKPASSSTSVSSSTSSGSPATASSTGSSTSSESPATASSIVSSTSSESPATASSTVSSSFSLSPPGKGESDASSDQSPSNENVNRKRRSMINPLLQGYQVDTYAEESRCYSIIKTVNGSEVTERGCTESAKFCENKEGCKLCDTDECNNGASNIVFSSMILSMAIIVLFTK
ncbi:PREDICTED: uncharacterized serine-rich protein C215.13-like [Eufriesea mexicana]|uniref:uncharacterized serine-rich protein C215.13-like n=1 Tax=Eufriesea mexicana TaxID=516756 RepID=UPI00083C2D94|nr:PREDICTED: uncharacterized serine-rich protein C215.13-like [Eufriesea mexicana]